MAMTPEERRAKNRERQARFRAAQREKEKLEALPRIGPSGRDGGVTDSASVSPWAKISNEQAALDFLDELTVPATVRPLAVKLVKVARDLDSDAIAQRSALSQRHDELIDAIVAACKPRERDELDDMRRKFYSGSVDAIDDDPEASGRRAVRKKA